MPRELSKAERDTATVLRRIRRDPVWFLSTICEFDPWSKQQEIAVAVRDEPRVAVRSSHSLGKTAIAARIVLWFLAAFAGDAKVITTAPTWRQVKDLLWAELASGHERTFAFFEQLSVAGAGHLTQTGLEFSPDWFAEGFSTKDSEKAAGYHSPRLLVVIDEASGVDQKIFEVVDGLLPYRVLLLGNPTQVGGEFHAAFHGDRALYHTIHMNAFDAPSFTGEAVSERAARSLPDQQWVAFMAAKYRVPAGHERGEPGAVINPVYQVRVLGQFPDQSNRAVVSMAAVEAAQARGVDEVEDSDWPRVVACDPARFGEDETVIAVRRGQSVRVADVANGQDTMRTAGELLRIARAEIHPLHGKPVVVVDEIGIGAGIVDRLREVGEFRVVAYNAADSVASTNRDNYPNARSELWFEFGEDWLPRLSLDADEDLLSDLCAPEYTIDSSGRRVVEKKEETKKRLGRSPDRADAVMMTCCRKVVAGGSAAVPIGLAQPGGSKWLGS